VISAAGTGVNAIDGVELKRASLGVHGLGGTGQHSVGNDDTLVLEVGPAINNTNMV
jgi:hypothetical protein